MRVLGAIVQVPALPVLDPGQGLTFRHAIALQLVGHEHARHILQALEQLLEEALGRLGIAPALNQDVEDLAILVHGAPEIVQLAADADEDLVQVPLVARTRSSPAQLVGEGLSELEAPAADALVGDDHAALGQDQLHVAQAQAEDVVQPVGMGDDLGWKAVAMMWVRRAPHPTTLAYLASARQPALT